ncbi:hypothetical protein RRG08_041891 [Elysia crispata]|uniref:Uncharacterized protein n=1 Tax=Elysia crispata TaxID=231223 RepID=A0AAE0Y0L2_9GAST|nr:hypothetical protein RRG08_041891 [Elysia crispata]
MGMSTVSVVINGYALCRVLSPPLSLSPHISPRVAEGSDGDKPMVSDNAIHNSTSTVIVSSSAPLTRLLQGQNYGARLDENSRAKGDHSKLQKCKSRRKVIIRG